MSVQTRRIAALLEVLGVYLAGPFLSDQIANLLLHWRLISPANPFALLTSHTTNADLLIASRQLLVVLLLTYLSYFLLIAPINWWHRRRTTAAYGLTRAGRPGKTLLLAALATSALTQWPVLVHSLVDVFHPLGAMAPWRQAFFDMSWRLAEDWGDGPAIIGVACLFTFAHPQYLIANAYNVTMIVSLFCMAIGLGVVFAWTRSLVPSMIAHAIINVPLTPLWQGVLLVLFAAGTFFVWRGGARAIRQVFVNTRAAACVLLAVILAAYAIAAHRINAMTPIAIGMLLAALALEAIDRRESRHTRADSMPM